MPGQLVGVAVDNIVKAVARKLGISLVHARRVVVGIAAENPDYNVERGRLIEIEGLDS